MLNETYTNEEIQFATKLIHHLRVITKYDKVTIKRNDDGSISIDFDSKHRDTFKF